MTREELLSAYLDGELEPAAAAEVERDLERDPSLAELLARMIESDSLLRDAVAALAGAEGGQALAARYGLTADAPAISVAPAVPANDNLRWRWPVALGTVAAAALGLLVAPPSTWHRGGEASGFDGAMERTASLDQAVLADGRVLIPRLTVQAADGSYCREYEMSAGKGARTGIACRRDGKWNVLVEEAASAAPRPASQIELAGGEMKPALDAAYRSLNASDPFDAAHERALISRRWTTAKSRSSPE